MTGGSGAELCCELGGKGTSKGLVERRKITSCGLRQDRYVVRQLLIDSLSLPSFREVCECARL